MKNTKILGSFEKYSDHGANEIWIAAYKLMAITIIYPLKWTETSNI